MVTRIHIIAAARPNFMKAAPLYHALKANSAFDVKLVHTGQHYDENMSGTFLKELGLPEPDFNLKIGSGRHGAQTGAVIARYEELCLEINMPDWVVVIGDVNSTIGCALAASKIGIKIAHLEAGLRSFDRTMPEEINRILTDQLADILWTPSVDGDEHLLNEGIPESKIIRIGNIMIDSLEMQREKINAEKTADKHGLTAGKYAVVTLHRPANVDTKPELQELLDTMCRISEDLPLTWPLHPRTKAKMEEFGLFEQFDNAENILCLEPLGYSPFMSLVQDSACVITDSGGIQEETTYLGIPCLTLRPNTERPITITEGTNQLVTTQNIERYLEKALAETSVDRKAPELWDGKTALRAVKSLEALLEQKTKQAA